MCTWTCDRKEWRWRTRHDLSFLQLTADDHSGSYYTGLKCNFMQANMTHLGQPVSAYIRLGSEMHAAPVPQADVNASEGAILPL